MNAHTHVPDAFAFKVRSTGGEGALCDTPAFAFRATAEVSAEYP